jgi:hypothetical protein
MQTVAYLLPKRWHTTWNPALEPLDLAAESGVEIPQLGYVTAGQPVDIGVDPLQWTPYDFAKEVFTMPKSHPPDAPQFRQQVIEAAERRGNIRSEWAWRASSTTRKQKLRGPSSLATPRRKSVASKCSAMPARLSVAFASVMTSTMRRGHPGDPLAWGWNV